MLNSENLGAWGWQAKEQWQRQKIVELEWQKLLGWGGKHFGEEWQKHFRVVGFLCLA